MTHRTTRIALAASAALASLSLPAAFAQTANKPATPGSRLDQVVVTAIRTPQRLADVLADITVINREEIERQAFGTLADLLRNHGAVEMTRNGGPSGTTSLYLRGADNRHTLVLLDGVHIDSQATGGASWTAIPLDQIDHVEILKGPASAVYGSDAVGGVVQIFTRKGGSDGKTRLSLGIAAGNLQTSKLDGSVTGGNQAFDYALSVAGERSKGFNATTPDNTYSYIPDRDGWRNCNASLRLGVNLAAGSSGKQRLELVAMNAYADGQYDSDSFTPQADDHSIQLNRALGLKWASQWSEALSTELSATVGSDHYETKSFDNPFPFPYLTDTTERTVGFLGSYQLARGQQLKLQLERREDSLENVDLVDNGQVKRHENAIALGYLFSSPAADLQIHARHDADSEFGGVNTGTLAAGFKLGEALRVFASAGSAFRAPNLYQRGSVYGPDLSRPGVKPLAPEHGRNLEIGLRYAAQTFELSATAYRNRVRDLISFGAPGSCASPYGCYMNTASARLQGLNLAAGTQLGGVRLSATLDLQAPKDETTGRALARRAKAFGTVRADTTLGNWHLGGGVQASGKRFNNAANTVELGGYALVNFDLQYKLSRDLRVQLNVDNAFNRHYQTAGGYTQAPRTVLVGLRYTPSF